MNVLLHLKRDTHLPVLYIALFIPGTSNKENIWQMFLKAFKHLFWLRSISYSWIFVCVNQKQKQQIISVLYSPVSVCACYILSCILSCTVHCVCVYLLSYILCCTVQSVSDGIFFFFLFMSQSVFLYAFISHVLVLSSHFLLLR